MQAYREQLERVRRYLKRIRIEDRDSVDYDDDLWSFFQNSWHLKDWIKNDSSIPAATRDRILREAESTKNLQICADLANRTKHFELTRKRRNAKVTSRNVTVFPGQDRPSESTHIITLDDGSQVIAQQLAKDIVKAWENILRKEHLI